MLCLVVKQLNTSLKGKEDCMIEYVKKLDNIYTGKWTLYNIDWDYHIEYGSKEELKEYKYWEARGCYMGKDIYNWLYCVISFYYVRK